MISVEKGNLIYLQAEATEAMNFTLPDGYSIAECYISGSMGIFVNGSTAIPLTTGFHAFPTVNGCNPNTFRLSGKAGDTLTIEITKFGFRPDANYFADVFEPLNILGRDGNEYNVIPTMRG